jgi:magnesium chelatase accessory protein
MAGALDWDRDGAGWPNRELSEFVSVGALGWHVQRAEAPGRPSILLLHGTGGASHSWRGLLPLLRGRFGLAAPDLPGHGFTRTPPLHPLGLPAMTADLAGLLAAIRFLPELIVGHSAGGAIALRLLLDGRVRPRRLILVNPALTPFKGIAGIIFPMFARAIWLAPFASGLAARYASSPGTVERLLAGTGSRIDPAGADLYRRLFASPAHAAGALGMMAQWDLSALARELPAVDRPVTLLLGGRDGFVPPASTRRIAARIPGAEIRELPGYGHLLHEEAPEIVAALAAEALGG